MHYMYLRRCWQSLQVRKIVNSFEADGILVSRAKAVVNDSNVTESLHKIQRDSFSSTCSACKDSTNTITHVIMLNKIEVINTEPELTNSAFK